MTMIPVEARALYLPCGGIISAEDPRVTHSSYLELGLRCTVCGEPVQYKNGLVNIAHFAHFPSLDPKKREDCDRRRTSGGGYGSTWPKLSKGQKLKLFQNRFFNILSESLQGLEPYNSMQRAEDTHSFDPACLETLHFLRNRKECFIEYIRTCDHHKVGLLEVDIACEAFDYLTVVSSQQMTLSILKYLISQQPRAFVDDENFSKEIGFQLSNVLLTFKWPQMFIEGEHLKTRKGNLRPAKSKRKSKLENSFDSIKLFHKIENKENLFVYLKEDSVILGTIIDDDIVDVNRLGTLDVKEMLKTERAEKSRREQAEQSIYGPFTIRIIQKNHLFRLSENLIETKFMPLLQKTIQLNTKRSKETIVRAKGYGGSVRLNMTVGKFLRIKSATILSKEDAIAEVVLENAAIQRRSVLLFDQFFTGSEEYSKITRDEFMIREAVLLLIRKTRRVLSKERRAFGTGSVELDMKSVVT